MIDTKLITSTLKFVVNDVQYNKYSYKKIVRYSIFWQKAEQNNFLDILDIKSISINILIFIVFDISRYTCRLRDFDSIRVLESITIFFREFGGLKKERKLCKILIGP